MEFFVRVYSEVICKKNKFIPHPLLLRWQMVLFWLSLKRQWKGYVDYTGDELDSIIPPISRRQGAREKKKMDVLEKIKNIVDVFVGI